MGDAKSAWKDTGDRFTALGASLKAHYETAHDSEAEAAKQELGEAARRFASAVQDAVDALGAAAKDPDVKEEVRKVGTSLADALSATFAEVSEDIKRMAQGKSAGQSEPEAPESGPASPPASDAEPELKEPNPFEGEDPPKLEPWGTP